MGIIIYDSDVDLVGFCMFVACVCLCLFYNVCIDGYDCGPECGLWVDR